jgi:hypothetical protein
LNPFSENPVSKLCFFLIQLVPLHLGWLVSGKSKQQDAAVAAARAGHNGGAAGGGEGGEQALATEIPSEYNIRPSFLGGDMFGLADNEPARRRPDGGVRTEALRAGGRRVAAPQGQMPRMADAPAAPRVPPPPAAAADAGVHGAGAGGGASAGVGAGAEVSPSAAGARQRSGKKGRR